MSSTLTSDDALLMRLIDLAERARGRGVAVSPAKTADLIQAVGMIDVVNRSALQRVVRLTLSGTLEDGPVLDALVRELFPPFTSAGNGPRSLPDLREQLTDALAASDHSTAAELGAHAADLVSADSAGQQASFTRASQRALRAMELSQVLRRAMKQSGGLDRDTAEGWQRSLEAFETELNNSLRDHHQDETASGDDVLDTDLMQLSEAEKQALYASVQSLARKIATRLRTQRATAVDGRLDVRRTQRRALSTGGVPLDPVLRRRRKRPPKLIMLCDVSGSMADYTRFSLALLSELVDQLPGVSAHVFVDGSADVTHLLAARGALIDTETLLLQPGVITGDGHSDYASALRSFRDSATLELDPRSVVLLVGDAQTRGLDPGVDVLRSLSERCKKLHWLNPDPLAQWDTAHSSARLYEAVCDQMVEIRTIRQLAEWIDTIL